MKPDQTILSASAAGITCPVCGSSAFRLLRQGPVHSYLQCEECSGYYAHSREAQVTPQVLFDNYGWTQSYNRQYDAYLPLIQYSLEQKLQTYKSITGLRPKSMLDVGCGNGLYTHAAKLMGLKVVGTEVDASSAELAKQHGLDVRIGKLEELDIPEKFDFVHIKAVLH